MATPNFTSGILNALQIPTSCYLNSGSPSFTPTLDSNGFLQASSTTCTFQLNLSGGLKTQIGIINLLNAVPQIVPSTGISISDVTTAVGNNSALQGAINTLVGTTFESKANLIPDVTTALTATTGTDNLALQSAVSSLASTSATNSGFIKIPDVTSALNDTTGTITNNINLQTAVNGVTSAAGFIKLPDVTSAFTGTSPIQQSFQNATNTFVGNTFESKANLIPDVTAALNDATGTITDNVNLRTAVSNLATSSGVNAGFVTIPNITTAITGVQTGNNLALQTAIQALDDDSAFLTIPTLITDLGGTGSTSAALQSTISNLALTSATNSGFIKIPDVTSALNDTTGTITNNINLQTAVDNLVAVTFESKANLIPDVTTALTATTGANNLALQSAVRSDIEGHLVTFAENSMTPDFSLTGMLSFN
jgi:phenylpyruvate tautomerase PptA (4-oxalocrotonate tautomerase family)